MPITKSQIDEVPLWKVAEGNSVDWFYRELARFAGQINEGARQRLIVTGSATSPTDQTVAVKPILTMSSNSDDITNTDNTTYYFLFSVLNEFDIRLGYDAAFAESPENWRVAVQQSPGTTRTDNGDGTWTVDSAALGVRTGTGTNYWIIFCEE